MGDNCLFCKIGKGLIPSQKIFENENVFGFVTFKPINEWDNDVQIKAYQDFS